ncbi:MAG TPA: hypothetical protein VGF95_02520 [Solirubrobacteraceae bacterium]|jgi:hypothetical protein
MSPLAAALLIMLIATVAAIVAGPLSVLKRRQPPRHAMLAELEAQREAKYRDIRDAELDHEMGKHSEQDYEEIASTLRSEAVEILNRIEALQREGEEEARAEAAGGEPPSTR